MSLMSSGLGHQSLDARGDVLLQLTALPIISSCPILNWTRKTEALKRQAM